MDEEFEFLYDVFSMLVLLYLKYKKTRKPPHKKRRWHIRPLNQVRLHKDHRSLFTSMELNDEEHFFKYIRMNQDCFYELLSKLIPKLQKQLQEHTISPKTRLAITLSYLAQGGRIQQVAWNFHIGKTTASLIIKETCQALWDELASIYIKFPSTVEEWKQIAYDFEYMWNLPNCLGAIDGKHITIQAPNKSGTMYFNYKKNFSIVLLAVCDANYIFKMVNIGSYGSHNDRSIYSYSEFAHFLEEGEMNLPPPQALPQSDIMFPYYFVGDSAFPLKPYLMRPYPGNDLSFHQVIFNYRLSRARRTIENAFGMLSSRWRVLRNNIIADVNVTEKIVGACICLHNYLRIKDISDQKDKQTYTSSSLIAEVNQEFVQGQWQDITRFGNNNSSHRAKELRDTLADYLTKVGTVPWQNEIIIRGSHPK